MSGPLRVVPLGGLGEIGLNLLLLEYGDTAIAVDCGVMFPDEQMLGIDVVIPDFTYLRALGDVTHPGPVPGPQLTPTMGHGAGRAVEQ